MHYSLHPQVAIRPEQFGALAYHYGNRRLTFLGTRTLDVLTALESNDDLDAALLAAEVPEAQWPAYREALDKLAASEVLTCD